MTEFRIDLYTEPHKELRTAMFELAIMSANSDCSDSIVVNELKQKAMQLFTKLEKHAHSEDTYAHPIIGSKMLSSREELEKDHQIQHDDISKLIQILDDLTAENDPQQRTLIGAKWYQAFNRFIADNLTHLDKEETNMPHLRNVCAPAELFAIMVAFSSHEEPTMLSFILHHAHLQLTSDELTHVFTIMRARLGETIFDHALASAEHHISAPEIVAIRTATAA